MDIAHVKSVIAAYKLEEYQLRCDNGVLLRHTKEFPIGYFVDNGQEFCVQLIPNTLQTNSLHINKDTNGIEPHFSVSTIPMEIVQMIEHKPTRKDAKDILDNLKLRGAFTEEQVNSLLANKTLYGIR